jgi:hypothetical protein
MRKTLRQSAWITVLAVSATAFTAMPLLASGSHGSGRPAARPMEHQNQDRDRNRERHDMRDQDHRNDRDRDRKDKHDKDHKDKRDKDRHDKDGKDDGSNHR